MYDSFIMKEKVLAFYKYLLKSKLILIPIVVVLALIMYRFKGLVVAATVNGEPVSRLAVISQLEKEDGKNVLDNELVIKTLILQEANKEKITVTSAELTAKEAQINDQLKTQGQDLDSVLATQGMTKADLNDQM